jgi:hypothetical protein
MKNYISYKQTFAVAGCPGWVAREYNFDFGRWDAVNGIAITPGFDTFLELKAYLVAEYFTVKTDDTSGGYFS